MEGKRIKRKHFKWRLLKNISLVLAVSMIASSMVSYWYFEKVVREQKLSDERSSLQQLSNQLGFMTEDIKRFAESILIDEELQRLLDEETDNSEFQMQRRYDKVTKRLVFYNNLRTYLTGTILHTEDGVNYGSSYHAMDSAYMEEKLQMEELTRYAGKREGVYSDPYGDLDEKGNHSLICYQVQMFDQYHFGQKKGTLYMEIDLDYFLEQVRSFAGKDDHIYLLGNNGNILYGQDPDEKLLCWLKEREPAENGIYRAKDGYVVCESIHEAGWKLCTLITNKELWERSRFVLVFFILSFLLSVGFIIIFISGRMEAMIRPVTELSEKMQRIGQGQFETIETVHTGDEIETLYECFGTMMQELQKGEEERISYERQKREMEYDILLSQINPHYLYNVLNTVVYLAAAGKNKDVVKIVHSLIYTLHDTLNIGDGSVETTIEKEITLTRCYLDIQKYRYPDIFTVDIRCEDGMENCRVPKTIIQPLVENAILHGILPAERKGKILVSISESEGNLHILVEDDGIGISSEKLERFRRGEELVSERGERKHIGISNVRDRIRYLYGEAYGMEIRQKEESGTSVLLWMPVQEMEEEHREALYPGKEKEE